MPRLVCGTDHRKLCAILFVIFVFSSMMLLLVIPHVPYFSGMILITQALTTLENYYLAAEMPLRIQTS